MGRPADARATKGLRRRLYPSHDAFGRGPCTGFGRDRDRDRVHGNPLVRVSGFLDLAA